MLRINPTYIFLNQIPHFLRLYLEYIFCSCCWIHNGYRYNCVGKKMCRKSFEVMLSYTYTWILGGCYYLSHTIPAMKGALTF